jgi:hypothetical protein
VWICCTIARDSGTIIVTPHSHLGFPKVQQMSNSRPRIIPLPLFFGSALVVALAVQFARILLIG